MKRKKAKLTKREKREMLEGASDIGRREDFRKLRELAPRRTFEEAVAWLTQINRLPKKF